MKESGKVGFDKPNKPQSKDIISKEESMFKIDSNGEVIPEKYPIEIYDRDLDFELMEEATLLSQAIKKRDSIWKVLDKLKKSQDDEINQIKTKIKTEKDETKLKELRKQLMNIEQTKVTEEVKEMINYEQIELGIQESQMLIRELNKKIAETKQIKYIELKPCNISEAYFAFEQGKSVTGEEVDDWIDDLITKKVTKPAYTLKELKNLRKDYKISIKEAIMKCSNYKTKTYKDLIIENNIKGTLREKK